MSDPIYPPLATQETVEANFLNEPENRLLQTSDPFMLKNKITELYQFQDHLQSLIKTLKNENK